MAAFESRWRCNISHPVDISVPGKITHIAAARLSQASGVNGDGVLAKLTFKATGSTNSPVVVKITEAKLIDSKITFLAIANIADGSITINPPAPACGNGGKGNRRGVRRREHGLGRRVFFILRDRNLR